MSSPRNSTSSPPPSGDNAPIAVVGMGLSGRAAVTFLAQRGHTVLACDENPSATFPEHPGVEPLTGPLPEERLAHCRTVLLSPGIPREHAGLSRALKRGVPIINDVEWLYRHATKRNPSVRITGITGSNGKSTVTTLIGKIHQAAGMATAIGGNLGQAALSLWDENTTHYVLELSSFQLESIQTLRCPTALITNISPDHLDRYSTFKAYAEAKYSLFHQQQAGDVAIVPLDDPDLLDAVGRHLQPGVRLLPFSARLTTENGIHVENGHLVDNRTGTAQPIIAVDEIRMVGMHNLANAASTTAAALSEGIEKKVIREVLRSFGGLPHRMEWVRTLNGVTWYNDSKGTNVGAVMESLGSFTSGVILIAGGRDKKGDFSPLAPLVQRIADGVILIGEAADAMERALHGTTRIQRADTLEQAVAFAAEQVRKEGTVLLSPACASFDMFRGFEDRGERFREAVHAL
ncbi:MAG: UDP-N-acetylmuramoyl-L-alanine--D-glutamate ligase [Magnetococcales bacterium]|nr:UDP-N-acetylmuramoyl-L-alanine--D-glutamate ligase [Magnetococcales bacterium]